VTRRAVQHDAHDHERHAGITGEGRFLLELHVHSSPVARRPLPLG